MAPQRRRQARADLAVARGERRLGGRVADPEVTRPREPVNGAGRLARYDENPFVARRDLAQKALNDGGARAAVGGHLDQRPQVRSWRSSRRTPRPEKPSTGLITAVWCSARKDLIAPSSAVTIVGGIRSGNLSGSRCSLHARSPPGSLTSAVRPGSTRSRISVAVR